MAKSLKNAKGSSAIPLTPFLENGELDVEVLEKEIEFFCNSGVGSICGPVNVSEFMLLTEEERLQMIKIPIDVASDRTCIIANVASPNVKTSVKYAEYAEKCGADALIAMPPYVGDLDFGGVKEYFIQIAKSTSLPIMVQNMPFTNILLTTDNIIELCEMAPNISWVKQEVPPAPVSVETLNLKKTDAVEGYMSGYSGLYSVQDYENGAIGTIHAGEYCDIVQRVWNLMDEDKMLEARKLHAAITPALLLEGIYTWQYPKYILKKRGIFKNYIVRNRCNPLSNGAIREFDETWEYVKTLL